MKWRRHLLTCACMPRLVVLDMIFPRCMDITKKAAGNDWNGILKVVDAGEVWELQLVDKFHQ